jgi:hypothetical protein
VNTVEPLSRENSSCRKVIYMGGVQGPEKVNDICVKTVYAGTIDFTRFHCIVNGKLKFGV